jgi:hypothetical protein
MLQSRVQHILQPPWVIQPPHRGEQRVIKYDTERRVIDNSPIITIPHITDNAAIMDSWNLTAKCALKTTPCLHHHVTRNNTLGIMPVPILDNIGPQQTQTQACVCMPQTYVPLPSCTQQRIVTWHAINALTKAELDNINLVITPNSHSGQCPNKA